MKFQANKNDLVATLALASQATTTKAKSFRAVFAGLLCEVKDNTLRVTGTDGMVTIHAELAVEAAEDGRALIPGKLFAQTVRSMPKGPVIVVTESDEDEIVDIIGGENYSIAPQSTIRLLNDLEDAIEYYSRLGAPPAGVDIDGAIFSDAIAQVMSAIDKGKGARPILEGILFEPREEGLRLVTTDTYRLAVRDLPGVTMGGVGGVVPMQIQKLLRSMKADRLNVGFSEREAVFSSERGSIRLRLIEGEFPKYKALFPKSYPAEVVTPKEKLLDALGRAAIVAEGTIPIRLTLGPDGIELGVIRQEDSRMKEHLQGSFHGLEYGFSIAFNPRYLADGVAAVTGDEVRIQITDENKPGLIQGVGDDNFRYLLMPVRIK